MVFELLGRCVVRLACGCNAYQPREPSRTADAAASPREPGWPLPPEVLPAIPPKV